MKTLHHIADIWYLLLYCAIILYVGWYTINSLIKTGKSLSMMTKKKTTFHRNLRKLFCHQARMEGRIFLLKYCDESIPAQYSYTVDAIMRYEYDLPQYTQLYIDQGFDRMYVKLLSKTEEVTKFVIDWRSANREINSEQMLELYLNETKP